jgi:MoxR-like ATPase
MQGRSYVLPDDVRDLAAEVLAHRLLPTMEATMSGRRTADVVQHALAQVPVPPAGPAGR